MFNFRFLIFIFLIINSLVNNKDRVYQEKEVDSRINVITSVAYYYNDDVYEGTVTTESNSNIATMFLDKNGLSISTITGLYGSSNQLLPGYIQTYSRYDGTKSYLRCNGSTGLDVACKANK